MRLPVITGIIDRRILVNYRVDSAAIAPLVPLPFRPKLVRGWAVGGICLIRLRDVRPRHVPRWLGLSSENAAHRIAIEWDSPGGVREGVYVRRRDTSSRLNCLAGGRVFPGVHHHAAFRVRESDDHFEIAMQSDDDDTSALVRADLTDQWGHGSVFDSLAEASAFFAAGSLGYSPAREPNRFQGIELVCRDWSVEPLDVQMVRSSLFDDQSLFPLGSVEFDCALLMRGIAHEWHGRDDFCCAAYGAAMAGSSATGGAVSRGTASPIAAA